MATPLIPAIAADQFRRRQTRARTAYQSGGKPLAQLEAMLRPWFAIALRAGAVLPESEAELEHMHALGMADSEGEARRRLADDHCEPPHWYAPLAKARDKAIDTHEAALTPETLAEARALIALADHFRAQRHAIPLYRQSPAQPERKAA